MKISLDANDLRPVIEAVVAETIDQFESDRAKFGNRLAYIEPEAAALLGIAPHVLRDCRLRGEISATKAGKRLLYERGEILRFLGVRRNGKA